MSITKDTAAIIIFVMLFFTGCSSSGRVEDGLKPADYSLELKAEITDIPEKYLYTMCIPYGDRIHNDKRYQLLAKTFNIDFEFISVAETDWDQKIKAWVAAGDLPDITTWDVDYKFYNQYRDYVQKRIVKAIPELSAHFPNLQRIRDDMFSDDVFEINGKLFIWLSYADTTQYNNLSNEMFFYRKDWAEKLGIGKEEYTWNEVLDMAKAFITADPGENGKGATIGMGCTGDAFPDVMGMRFISTYWDGYYFKDNHFFWGPSQPETLKAVVMARRMYDEGLFWSEQPYANPKDAENRFIEGRMGIYWTDWSIERINEIRSKIVKANPELNVDDIAPLIIRKTDGRYIMQRRPDFCMGTFFNASLSDEKQARILQMWDWLAGEEGMKFMSMGIKGRDWDFKDGKPVLYWDRIEDGTMTDPNTGEYGQWFWNVVRLNKSFYFNYPCFPEHAVKTSREILEYKLKPEAMIDIRDLDLVTPVLDSPLLRQKDSYNIDPQTQLIKIILESENAPADWTAWVDNHMPEVEKILNEYEYLYKLYNNY